MKKAVYITLAIIAILLVGTMIVLQMEVFGAKPSGARLERIQQSKNYRDGEFQNLSVTPSLAEGYNYAGVLYDFLIKKKDNVIPAKPLPSVGTDLKHLPAGANVLVWFGHSSYLIQLDGKTYLIDPVMNGYAAPFRWMNKAFPGTDRYHVADLPKIDYLLITHDHYDHLDMETIKQLKGKVGKVVCALGVGAHLERWGYPAEMLIEQDWDDSVALDSSTTLHFTPARHFSGRGLKRNNTLWTSYVLESRSKRLFLGGDSGYDKHFEKIGEQFGGFDLAILENGQYNEAWRYIHTLPDEFLKVSKALHAKRVFPVHSSKFDLGGHPWDEPLKKVTALNGDGEQDLVTPMIGEVLDLDNEAQVFSKWWQGL